MSASEARRNPDRLAHRRASDKLKILQEELNQLTGYTTDKGRVIPPGTAKSGTFGQFVHQPGSDLHTKRKA